MGYCISYCFGLWLKKYITIIFALYNYELKLYKVILCKDVTCMS